MSEKKLPGEETVQSDLLVHTTLVGEEDLFLSHRRSSAARTLVPSNPPLPSFSPRLQKIYLIFLIDSDENKLRRLPDWLHELIGWSVFLIILATFLGIQIYLDRLFSGNRFAGLPLDQIVLLPSIVVEIGLLWQWERYWY